VKIISYAHQKRPVSGLKTAHIPHSQTVMIEWRLKAIKKAINSNPTASRIVLRPAALPKSIQIARIYRHIPFAVRKWLADEGRRARNLGRLFSLKPTNILFSPVFHKSRAQIGRSVSGQMATEELRVADKSLFVARSRSLLATSRRCGLGGVRNIVDRNIEFR
jgi:hypothetical protein